VGGLRRGAELGFARHLRAGEPAQLVGLFGDSCLALRKGDVPPDLVIDVLDLDLPPPVAAALLAWRLAARAPFLFVVVLLLVPCLGIVGEDFNS
jgi:hypothetical protein